MDAYEVIRHLGLKPHPEEGGYYRETHRSELLLDASALPSAYGGSRCVSTAIYYLMTPDTFSALHRLPGEEVFHFYLGDPVEMLQLHPHGGGELITLGTDLMNGMVPQVVVPGHAWQGSRVIPGGSWALLGTTVAPGFEFADYVGATRTELVVKYPAFRDLICSLTRE